LLYLCNAEIWLQRSRLNGSFCFIGLKGETMLYNYYYVSGNASNNAEFFSEDFRLLRMEGIF
jgi:hypothetical protein